jgi:membrane protease YdiL (CAAX protease family)
MGEVEAASLERTSLRYWLMVLALIALGFLTIFSLGLYFWFIALALVLLSPFRSRPRIFRSGIALSLGFLIGYVLVAPWGCVQSFTSDPTTGEETVSPVVCTSPIGIEYSGLEPFDPSRTPALFAGGASAVIAAGVTWMVTAAKRNRTPAREGA